MHTSKNQALRLCSTCQQLASSTGIFMLHRLRRIGHSVKPYLAPPTLPWSNGERACSVEPLQRRVVGSPLQEGSSCSFPTSRHIAPGRITRPWIDYTKTHNSWHVAMRMPKVFREKPAPNNHRTFRKKVAWNPSSTGTPTHLTRTSGPRGVSIVRDARSHLLQY